MRLNWMLIMGLSIVASGCGDSSNEDGDASSTATETGADDGGDGPTASGPTASGPTAGDGGSGGGSGDGSGGSDTATTDGDSTGGGSDDPWGNECEGDGDCPDGQCVALVEGGVKVCVGTPFEATQCGKGMFGDPLPHECCATDECEAGICTSSAYGPQCSGALIEPYNICLADTCSEHADCGDGSACIPAGALGFPVATCLQVACLSDADCTDGTGGHCAIVPSTTCCGDAVPRCRYDDSPPVGDECPP